MSLGLLGQNAGVGGLVYSSTGSECWNLEMGVKFFVGTK